MNLIEYRHSDDFWADNQAVITAHILEAELIYLNAQNHIGTEDGFFGVSVKDGTSTLLAVQTLPYPMILFIKGPNVKPMVSLLMDHLMKTDHIPAVINGNRTSTAPVVEAFRDRGIKYRPGRHLVQRKCEKLKGSNPLDLPLINANDIPYDFTADYRSFLEECHASYNPNKLQDDITSMLGNNDLYVLLDNDEIVTMGRLQRRVPDGRAVGVIYTPPKFRGHGYSTCCTWQLTHRIFSDGYSFAYLYAEASNPVSNHVYEKLGYRKTDDFIDYHKLTS